MQIYCSADSKTEKSQKKSQKEQGKWQTNFQGFKGTNLKIKFYYKMEVRRWNEVEVISKLNYE